ncbi:response regulator transcription factor [Paenibacillus oleatilyticus]|uniref:Response regulator n=1 Tax=Paenibacillus oleatilyticus TaxID=2594886 RepID=A0ABV4V1S8_9BACL
MHLLIVDDEPVIRRGLVKMAEQYSPAFTGITTAENGMKALESIRAQEPDIVLTDIRMPKMDGLELCRSIHEEFPDIQTVVISGFNDFEYAQKCLAYGVKQYLLKPVTKPELHEALDTVLKQKMKGYVPVSKYVEWVGKLEQCIWANQSDELARYLEQWRGYCLDSGLSAAKLRELLGDCIRLLVQRLQERNAFSVSPETKEAIAGHTKAELLDDFEQTLRAIYRRLISARRGQFKDPMEEAKAYIDQRLSEEVTLEEVAELVGLTPTYFSALFKKMTSETFVQYRIKRRMEKALQLMAQSHIRIVDVALEVGYDDYPHFTKTFKKIVGISPSEYRSQLGIK